MVTERTSVLQIADGKETWNSETETPHCSAAWAWGTWESRGAVRLRYLVQDSQAILYFI